MLAKDSPLGSGSLPLLLGKRHPIRMPNLGVSLAQRNVYMCITTVLKWLPPLPPTPDTTLRWSDHKCDSKKKGRLSRPWWRSWWAATIRAWDGSVQNGRWGWGMHQNDFGGKFKIDMGQTSKWMWGPPNSLSLNPREPGGSRLRRSENQRKIISLQKDPKQQELRTKADLKVLKKHWFYSIPRQTC